ncbi:hypothetical protein ACI2LM_07830 [Paenibacillus lautus]|nr:hypothetical protein [Paenibacillus lautus]
MNAVLQKPGRGRFGAVDDAAGNKGSSPDTAVDDGERASGGGGAK